MARVVYSHSNLKKGQLRHLSSLRQPFSWKGAAKFRREGRVLQILHLDRRDVHHLSMENPLSIGIHFQFNRKAFPDLWKIVL